MTATTAAPPRTVPAAPKRRTTLTREGRYWLLACAGLWLTGFFKGINLILLLAYLLLVLGALNWFVARRSLRGLRAERRLPEAVFAGSPAVWQAEVENTGLSVQTGWVLADEGPAHTARWFVERIGPADRVRLRREVTFARRGRWDCRPLKAVSSFPFGLVKHEVEFGTAAVVTVLPRLGTVNVGRLRRWLAQAARPDERSRKSRRRLALEVEFHGLRAFRAGDSPRWIHWRTSARKNELMVREFDQGTHHDLMLILEPFGDAADAPAVEAAVSLAASICWTWTHEAGDRVTLAVAGQEPVVVAGRGGADQALSLLAALADVAASAAPDLVALERLLSREPLPVGPALLVSARRSDSRAAADLTRRLERPVAYLDASDPPSFYHPPAGSAAAASS